MCNRACVATLLCVLALSVNLLAQGRVPTEFRNERLLAIVPMVGTGTEDDPVRPMFTPGPKDDAAGTTPKFLSIQYEVSDDGKTALVEFVAANRNAFKEILASQTPGVKVFERGKSTVAEVEQEFRKVKPTYDFDKSAGRAK